MSDLDLFVEAVRGIESLPADVRRDAHTAALRSVVFDDAFIALLDTQKRMSTRGRSWTRRIDRQLQALGPYRDRRLLKGRILRGLDAYWIYVEPASRTVVYWECYENWAEQLQ